MDSKYRQTGRTTRMLEEAFADDCRTAVIVVWAYYAVPVMTRLIYEHISKDMVRVSNTEYRIGFKRYIFMTPHNLEQQIRGMRDYRVFYDHHTIERGWL